VPVEIQLGTETLELLPEGAAYHKRTLTLFVADLHLGKAATFRKLGIPVPEGSNEETLQKLELPLTRTSAQQVVILGDFFHAAAGRTESVMESINAWFLRNNAIQFALVRGNHDRSAGDPPAEWQIQCVDEPYQTAGFCCMHEANTNSAFPVLSAHVHPVLKLEGKRFPCFAIKNKHLLFPAFGAFTGGHALSLKDYDQVFPLVEETVLTLPKNRAA